MTPPSLALIPSVAQHTHSWPQPWRECILSASACDHSSLTLSPLQVDSISEMLARNLRKYKEKQVDVIKGRHRETKLDLTESMIDAEDEDDA